MDNVEMYNCSQFDNGKAALRFIGGAEGSSSVTNSAIHHGLGWGCNVDLAANVYLKGNVFFDFI